MMKLPRLILALATAGASVTAAIAVGSGSSAADPQIRDTGGATAVKDSYLVVLRDTETAVASSAQRLAKAHGGKVGSVWSHALRGFSVTAAEAAARQIAKDPAVAWVSQNHTVQIAGTQSPVPSWGLDRIDQADLPLDNSYTYPNTASSVRIYVIDTGIRITHTDFGGRASHGWDFIDNDSNADDCNGHGTHVAGTAGGTAYGVAKQAQLVAVRVLNCSGSGTFEQVVGGVDWVTANAVKPAVANMSLGASGTNSVLEAAVANSIASGVQYSLAAGNSGADACNFTPARTPAAITVGSTTSSDARSSFSNYGSCLDVFAPGSSITSAWITSDTSTNTISGTSMAAPHVAGAAALILQANPGLSPQAVRDQMVAEATPNKVTSPGTGSPNLLLRATGGGTTPPPPPDCTGTNGTDVAIPDRGTGTSSITLSGCTGNASSSSQVEVHIVHPRRGGLTISLIAPDGTSYQLESFKNNDSTANVDKTYTVDLSSEAKNGTWRLQVQDRRRGDTGYINSWTITV